MMNGMKPRLRIAAISLLISLMAISLLIIWASASENYLFSKDLTVSSFVHDNADNSYAANASDGNIDLVHIFLRMQKVMNSSRVPILFSVWHAGNTELDSLTLTFSTGNYVTNMLYEPESYDVPIKFYRDGEATLFKIKNLGFYGTGTITLDFTASPFYGNALTTTIDFTMHYTSLLQLTELKVQTTLTAQVT